MSKILEMFEQLIAKFDSENKLEESVRSEMIDAAKEIIKEHDEKIISEAKAEINEEQLKTITEQTESQVKERAAKVLSDFDEYVLAECKNVIEKLSYLGIKKINSLNEQHAKEKENLISEQKDVITSKIDKYLDSIVKDHLPEKEILNEQRIARLETFYNNVRELSEVSNEDVQNVISKKVEEVESESKVLKEQLDAALKDKIELKKINQKYEKDSFISSKIKDLRPNVSKLVCESVSGLSLSDTKEKIDTIISAAESGIDSRSRRLKEKYSKSSSTIISEHVEQPRVEAQSENNDVMDTYVNKFSGMKSVSIK